MKVLAVSFYSDIWVHSVPETIILKGLIERGHQLSKIVCDGMLKDFCHSMAARGYDQKLPEALRRSTCEICRGTRDLLQKTLKSDDIPMESLISTEQILSIDERISKSSISELQNLVVDDLKIGSFALYEILLQFKKVSTDLNEYEEKCYRITLKQSLYSYEAAKEYFKQNSPDRVVIFSPQYAPNRLWAELAVKKGISVYFMEGGTNISERLKTLRAWKFNDHGIINPSVPYYGYYRSSDFSNEDLGLVENHLEALLSSLEYNVYSARKSAGFIVRDHFKIPAGKKIILASMSSYDEAYSAYCVGLFPESKMYSKVFRTQFDWIKALINFVKNREDLFLIIRAHPRDEKNRRESTISEQARILQDLLKNLPSNMVVNWPSENISIYDLAEDVDVVTTGWSVTGVEMSLLGIPVVIYDDALPTYPLDLVYHGVSAESYYKNIDRALLEGWHRDRSLKAIRWLAINFSKNVARMPKALNVIGAPVESFWTKWWRRFFRRVVKAPILNRRFELYHALSMGDRGGSTIVDMIEKDFSSMHEAVFRRGNQSSHPQWSAAELDCQQRIFRNFIERGRKGSPLVNNMKSAFSAQSAA